MKKETLKTNVVKRQVILADGTILRNEQIPAEAKAWYHAAGEKDGRWVTSYSEQADLRRKDRMHLCDVRQVKIGRHTHHVLNGWTIGWCLVVADRPVSKSAARAANKAVGMAALSEYAGRKAWPYLVDGAAHEVMTDHAATLQRAAEKGKLMADALLKHGITSRVFVMTDKQYGMGYLDGAADFRARQGRSLKGMKFTTIEKVGRATTWTLTEAQSVPAYQTSL